MELMNPITPDEIRQKKNRSKIVVLTAYDYSFAQIFDQAGVDILLVGDSVAMVCCGKKNTASVTMEQMLYHTEAVARGAARALVVTDMPAGSYATPQEAVANARRCLHAGAHAVKVEGGCAIRDVVTALRNEKIAVMGHIGLLPQTASTFSVKGKTKEEAEKLIADARFLDAAGVFSVVVEGVSAQLAQEITRCIGAPTIGIGAGASCDGQVLVSYDALGLFTDFRPKFVRHFLEGRTLITQAVAAFRQAIEDGTFPSQAESYK